MRSSTKRLRKAQEKEGESNHVRWRERDDERVETRKLTKKKVPAENREEREMPQI